MDTATVHDIIPGTIVEMNHEKQRKRLFGRYRCGKAQDIVRSRPEDFEGPRHDRIDQPRGRPRGVDHGQSKLTEADVREIRQRSEDGETYSQLARDYGVSRSTVGRIVQRKLWDHVV